ncbi:MAG: helix-turn-helix domain-containing protein [Cyanobacteriota bacterium]
MGSCFFVAKNEDVSSFKIITRIYSSGLGSHFNLTPSTLLVLIGLANHYNSLRKDMFPSQKYLAENINLSLSTVKRSIKDLESNKLITKHRTKYGNCYYFTDMFFDFIMNKPQKSQNKPLKSFKNTLQEQYKINIQNKHQNKQNDDIKIHSCKINTMAPIPIKSTKDNTKYNEMIISKYWKHIPTGKIYRIKSDIGDTIYTQYIADTQSVKLLKDQFEDKINNFIAITENNKNLDKYDLSNNLRNKLKTIKKIS